MIDKKLGNREQIIVAKDQETKAQIDQFNSDFAAGNYEPYIKPKTDEEEIA